MHWSTQGLYWYHLDSPWTRIGRSDLRNPRSVNLHLASVVRARPTGAAAGLPRWDPRQTERVAMVGSAASPKDTAPCMSGTYFVTQLPRIQRAVLSTQIAIGNPTGHTGLLAIGGAANGAPQPTTPSLKDIQSLHSLSEALASHNQHRGALTGTATTTCIHP